MEEGTSTGLSKEQPANVSRQISQRFTDLEEEYSSFCFSTACLIVFLACVPVVMLGILMVLVGLPNIFHCTHSWLPAWLFISGVNIIIFYPLFLFCALRFCFNRKARDPAERVKTGSCGVALIYLDIIFGLVWFGVGCYWTWTSVHSVVTINKKISQGYTPVVWWGFAEAAACKGPVLWFSLFVTIFPFIYIMVIMGLLWWRLRGRTAESSRG